MTKWMAGCLLALGTAVAGAHTGVSFDATSPDGTRDVQVLLPGTTGGYRLTVRNTSAQTGTAFVHAYLDSREESVAQYAFTSAEPRCSGPAVEQTQYGPKLFFAVGPLQAGETLACEFAVQRRADSLDDLGFSREYPCFDCVTRRGTLPDSALRVEAAGFDQRGALKRLVLANGGAVAIARRSVTTACAEFGGGFFDPRPFVLESDFPGGCPAAVDGGLGCGNFTGQVFDSYAYDLGPAPAGGESSCLVRMVPTGGPGPNTIDLQFREDAARLANGAIVFDATTANDGAVLGGSGSGSVGARATIPIPWSALAAIALAVSLTGVALLRRD